MQLRSGRSSELPELTLALRIALDIKRVPVEGGSEDAERLSEGEGFPEKKKYNQQRFHLNAGALNSKDRTDSAKPAAIAIAAAGPETRMKHGPIREERHKVDRHAFPGLPRVGVTVLFEEMPGSFNLGSLMRLADAFMIEKILIPGEPRSLDSQRIRATAMGSRRWVSVEFVPDALHEIKKRRRAGTEEILAAEVSEKSVPFQQYKREGRPVLLVLGSESKGVSNAAMEEADAILEIPIGGMLNSLNVITAAAILLAHLAGDEAARILENAPAKSEGIAQDG